MPRANASADTETGSEPRVPHLASDITRGWLITGAGLIPTVVVPFLLVALRDGLSLRTLTASTLLIGWTVIALTSSLVTWLVFRRASADELARWLAATTPTGTWKRLTWQLNGGGAVSWAITGSTIAVTAVVILGLNTDYRQEPLVVFPAVGVVVASLLMIISAYAVRYARENVESGGAEFPGGAAPRFVDYFYLSVQVSTTFSSSDVALVTSSMRRVVSLHSLIAFTFNTVIVALLVSVLITAIS